MRIFKSGILLFLILKSSLGFSMSMNMGTEACCNTNSDLVIEKQDFQEPLEEDKGCCDLNCECFCCAHTFISDQSTTNVEIEKAICSKQQSSYSNNYYFLVLKAIWQPPRCI